MLETQRIDLAKTTFAVHQALTNRCLSLKSNVEGSGHQWAACTHARLSKAFSVAERKMGLKGKRKHSQHLYMQ